MLKLALACLILIAALFYTWLESDMSDSNQEAETVTQEMLEKFKALQKSAFIVGYTGETGKELTRAVVQSGVFKRVVLVGRRVVDFSGDALMQNVEQMTVDFDKIENHTDVFKGIDVGFCCLGTTRSNHGVDMFLKVDYDYVVNTARVAKNAGVKEYQLVSSTGANKDSFFLYPKTKGRAEQALIDMAFDRLTIVRPGLLLCDRQEPRFGEKIATVLMAPLVKLTPTRFSVPTRTVGLAMLYRAILPAKEPVEFVHNAQLHHLATKLPTFLSSQ